MNDGMRMSLFKFVIDTKVEVTVRTRVEFKIVLISWKVCLRKKNRVLTQ